MLQNIYTLPEITFVAGEKQRIVMSLKTPKPAAEPYNANSCTVDFSIINHNNKIGYPILSKLGELQTDSMGIASVVIVELLPTETVTLYGKYIYQVSIIDIEGNTEIPNQGLMFITKNINQSFITTNFR